MGRVLKESVTTLSIDKYFAASHRAMSHYMSSYPMSEQDVDERVYVRVADYEFERHGDDTVPLVDFISTLQGYLDDTPEAADAVIKFSSTGWDDEQNAEYEVGYWRDPTKEERAAREAHNAKARDHNAALEKRKADKERAEFERLKAKYGD